MTAPPDPLESARERVVLELSNLFAEDRIPMEELDRRLELAYAASSVTDLEKLLTDLEPMPPAIADDPRVAAQRWQPAAQPPVIRDASELAVPRGQKRILAFLSESKRRGTWIVAPYVDVVAVMGSLVIDMRDATFTSRVVEMDLSVVMAQVTIIIPRGMRVIDDATAIMAQHNFDEHTRGADTDAPVLRLTGWSTMAEVTVRD
jgi:hypothetical protein